MICKKNKKAVSAIIGYVLLISIAIVMSGLVYQWMKSYVPTEDLECHDSVSVFLEDINCTQISGDYQLKLTLKNTGRFSIAGYFIHGVNKSNISNDISSKIVSGGNLLGNSVIFSQVEDNFMKPNMVRVSTFNLTEQISSVKIIPIRYQEQNNVKRFVSCGDATINEDVICS